MNVYNIDKSLLVDLSDTSTGKHPLIDAINISDMLQHPYGYKPAIMKCAGVLCSDCARLIQHGDSCKCPVCGNAVHSVYRGHTTCQGCGSKLKVCYDNSVILRMVTGCSQLMPGFEDKAEDVI